MGFSCNPKLTHSPFIHICVSNNHCVYLYLLQTTVIYLFSSFRFLFISRNSLHAFTSILFERIVIFLFVLFVNNILRKAAATEWPYEFKIQKRINHSNVLIEIGCLFAESGPNACFLALVCLGGAKIVYKIYMFTHNNRIRNAVNFYILHKSHTHSMYFEN